MDPMDRETKIEQEPDWNRREYVGDRRGDDAEDADRDDVARERTEPATPTWNKAQYVGDRRGDDTVADEMERSKIDEGESGLSGRGHPSGESHWQSSELPEARPRD